MLPPLLPDFSFPSMVERSRAGNYTGACVFQFLKLRYTIRLGRRALTTTYVIYVEILFGLRQDGLLGEWMNESIHDMECIDCMDG